MIRHEGIRGGTVRRGLIGSGWPYLVGAAALVAAGLGLSHWVAGAGPSAQTQFDVAAAVLSIYTAAVSLLATDRDDRTIWLSLLWGGAVPALVALVTAVAIIGRTHDAADLVAALPWLAGPTVSIPLGLVLPDFLRFGAWRR